MNLLKQNWFNAKLMKGLYTVLFVLMLVPFIVQAHPGNTASDGCHYCRTRCDYWGVAWNERHCHGGYTAPVYSTPIATPKPTIKPTSIPNTSNNVSAEVQSSQPAYYRNPHWFREKLINDLVKEFGSQYLEIISRLVYTLLPDVKN